MRRPMRVTALATATLATIALAATVHGLVAAAQDPSRGPAPTPPLAPPRRGEPAEADDRPRPPRAAIPPRVDAPPPPPLSPPVPTLPPSWQPPQPSLPPSTAGTPMPPFPFANPPSHAPQPHVGAGPGPQQPDRYRIVERIPFPRAPGQATGDRDVTLLLDSATGDAYFLISQEDGLAWRPIPRPPIGPQPPQPGPPVGPWSAPTGPAPFPVAPPFPSTAPTPSPSGAPTPFPPGAPPVPPPSPPPTPSDDPFSAGVTSPPSPPNPLVDPAGFRESVSEADRLRAERRVGEAAFVALAGAGSVILDCRSREKFDRLHVRGAVNLPFPDITAEELARVIPSPDTRVLLYCNNNFADAPAAFPAKVARAALNHHSFSTLVSYGYRNVFELGPLVDVATTEIPLEGPDAP